MPLILKDRVKVTTTTTGTGTYTLGAAASGYQGFSAVSQTFPWNVSTSTYAQGFSVAAQDATPVDISFKDDGTKMYVVGSTNASVYEYNLSTAWNVSTASYLQSFSVSARDSSPQGLFFKPDGTKMYVSGITGDNVYEYNLGTAWNISTATYLQSFSVATQDTSPNGLFFKPDGTKMYISGTVNDSIYEYDLSSAWNVSTASYLRTFSVTNQEFNPHGLFFKPDGTKMYIVGSSSDTVFEYTLSSAWNISTAKINTSFNISLQEINANGVFFRDNGESMYIVGTTQDTVFEYVVGGLNTTYYNVTDGTNWEIGIGTYNPVYATLTRTTILESSNSNAAVNWGAGSKDVRCIFPADATQGTVPTADDSSVGTDLVAWTNLKKQLDRGVNNGTPYANGNVSGMVSTYTLADTTTGTVTYFGGVLDTNGFTHCVPYLATSGQKISPTGVVSLYTLAYIDPNGGYAGGVLARNGDVHFVPFSAPVGQKVSASGVVSTYSLVYAAGGAYSGGVLAPNGDIHFVPGSAQRGQKISAAGVVSTYSLVYTTSAAYQGGVLAPNGDIHFVPFSAPVGQKISAAGVVSTYSLVYTTTIAYRGGVLAPNGDIHFVPHSANRGQKISSSGTVSTYSLVYTAGFYFGGVLAPNGDIHFIPHGANRGQKISAAGVVSTYSLVYTATSQYAGGVLNANGDINFIPYQPLTATGQRISTNIQTPIGYALSPFFNKF